MRKKTSDIEQKYKEKLEEVKFLQNQQKNNWFFEKFIKNSLNLEKARTEK